MCNIGRVLKVHHNVAKPVTPDEAIRLMQPVELPEKVLVPVRKIKHNERSN